MARTDETEAHTYTVALRFTGDHLEPADISERLNLQPSHLPAQRLDQASNRARRPFWAYNGHGEVGFRAEWESLEDGLQFLLGCLRAKKPEINLLASQFHGCWWCGHFQASFDGGPTLSPGLLAEIGSYGLPLMIDNYFSEPG